MDNFNPISDTVWEYMVTNHCSEVEAKMAIKKILEDIKIAARERLKVIEMERLNRIYNYDKGMN